ERVAAIVDVNLKGAMLGTRLAMNLMSQARGGVIVNTASVAGLGPNGPESVYNTTKAGIIFFTRCCAEFKDSHNIRCNCVCPGITDTPLLGKTGDGRRPAAWLEPILAMIEIIPPSEVADVVVGLIEDDSKNGEIVTIENKVIEQPA